MSDISPTRNLGEKSVSRPQVTSTTAAPTGTVANMPAALNNASIGTLLTALVAAQDARGLTSLQTDKGTLLLQTSLPLKTGSEIVLQLQSAGTQSRFLILSVDNQPVSGPAARAIDHARVAPAGRTGDGRLTGSISGDRAAALIGSAGTSQKGTAATVGTLGGTVTGNITTAPPLGLGSKSFVPGSLSAGLVVPARTIGNLTLTRASGQIHNAPSGAYLASDNPRTIESGGMLTLRILAVASPGTEALAPFVPTARSSLAILQGVISSASLSKGTAGQPIELTLPEGRLSLQMTSSLATGSRVLFEILEIPEPFGTSSRPPADAHQEFLRIGREWPALKEVIGAVRPYFGARGKETASLAAEPGPRMASSMLFFMSALKSGNMRDWLGESNADELTLAGRSAILGRLADEFATMGRHATEGQANGWNAVVLPIYGGGHTDLARLYYRHRKSSDEKDGESGSTHFVVEAELTLLGLFQLEGLVRSRQFDLIVHSTRDLSSAMRDNIREIFHESLNTGELAGSIRFEAGPFALFNPAGPASDRPGQAKVLVV